MGLVADIVGGIAAATGVIGKVVGGASKVIGGVLTDTGIAGLISVVGTLTSSISDVVTGFSDAVKPIIQPINDIVNSVGKLATTIQDDVIKPIIAPIEKSIKSTEDLVKTVSTLSQAGIEGILKIPGAISDALTGVSAAFDRTARFSADANGKIVSESMVPGFAAFMAPGLKGVSDAMLHFTSPGQVNPDQLGRIEIPATPGEFLNTKPWTDLRKKYENPKQWYDALFFVITDVFTYAAASVASIASYVEEGVAQAKYANPTTILGVGDVLSLYQKGIFSNTTAQDELQRNGLNDARAKALMESVLYLPDFGTLVDWLNRGIIGEAAFEKSARALGAISDDIIALKQASLALFPPQTLLDWLARGIIDQTFFDDQLRAQGYDAARIKYLLEAGINVPSLEVSIQAKGNALAGGDGWFSDTYLSKPSDDVVAIAQANRVSDQDLQSLWTAHFNAMPIQTAITLFFRGEMNRHEVEIVVAQNNYPVGMTDLLITSQSQMLMPRTIPALVARGALSEVDGMERLQQKGYSQSDALLLIEDAKKSSDAKASKKQTDATKLTVAELGSAYEDGIIDETTYKSLLGTHGLVGNDLDVVVSLKTYQINKAHKRAIADTVKAEVSLGVKTVVEGVQELYNANFTTPEIERLQTQFKQAKRTATKLPDLTLLSAMFKNQLIDETDYLAGIQAIGYAAPWDQRLVDLEKAKLNVKPKP